MDTTSDRLSRADASGSLPNWRYPVSYTHLDVYKRQEQEGCGARAWHASRSNLQMVGRTVSCHWIARNVAGFWAAARAVPLQRLGFERFARLENHRASVGIDLAIGGSPHLVRSARNLSLIHI